MPAGRADLDDGMDLASLNAALAPWRARVGARLIRPGDEAAFHAASCLAESAAARSQRRASGAARLVARRLIADLGGGASAPLPRGPSGAPVWPTGVIGSLAHDQAYAVAAVAPRGALGGLGVDVEPAEPLPADVEGFVLCTTDERRAAGSLAGRVVFACKEAVYKAVHPFDASPLEYADIAVRLDAGEAALADGRALRLFVATGVRIVCVALLEQGPRGA